MPKPHPNPGNFRNDPGRAKLAGKRGGPLSPGNFKHDHERARAAGRKGGLADRKLRKA